MRMEYKTYDDFRRDFHLKERWEVFDGSRSNLNIAHECLDRHPGEKTAVRIKFDDGRREAYTYGELSRLTSRFANMLERLDIKAGEPVAIVLNPSLELYVTLFGILKRGAVAVVCSPLFGPEAIEYRVDKSGAKMVVTHEEKVGLIKKGLVPHLVIAEEMGERLLAEDEHYQPTTSADTLAFLQFSSGATGAPKAVPYGHKAATMAAVHVKFGIGLREYDSYFCPSSPAWGMGIWYGTIGPLIFGNAVGAYSGKFDAEYVLQALREFQVTNLFAAPLVYRRIMESGKLDRLKLRRMTYTGGKLDMDVIRYFREKLGLIIQSCYGSTEVGVVLADYDFDDWTVKPGSLGKPLPGIRVAVVSEDGRELPQGMVGGVAVWLDGKWVRLGDRAYVGEDGYFWYQGRSDDVIISAGYTIGPVEIEEALLKHPAVKEAAVVGSPDKARYEIVKAFIVPKSGFEPAEELKRQIQEFIKTRLGKHEYPRQIEFLDELPRTPDGKIMRRLLRQREYEKG
ncbi:MAG: AMP-binding protein [Chloroflexi bacterium]|nr:AMP-binding protein [Chloroflexota bacterium]